MRTSGPRRPHCQGLALGLVAALIGSDAALPSAVASQQVYEDFYHHHALKIPLLIAADSLAIQLRDSVEESVVLAVLGPGYTVARRMPGRILVVAHSPLPRAQLFQITRELASAHDSVFRAAGFLAHGVDGRPPLLVGDEVIVRFQDSVSTDGVDSVLAAHQLDPLPGAGRAGSVSGRRRVARLMNRSGMDAVEVARQLHTDGRVVYAIPNFVGGAVPAGYDPDDPLAGAQWHLTTIEALAAWDVTRGSGDVVIAIVELDGFDAAHPDLCGKMIGGTCDHLWQGVDDGGNPIQGWDFENNQAGVTSRSDNLYHATAVAGLAAAVGDGVGVSGVCPDCKLMLLRAGQAWSDIGAAFEFASQKGADVVNASWDMWWPDVDLETVLKNAATTGRGGFGLIVVFAMPNITRDMTNQDRCDPATTYRATAALPYVLAVGGSTDADTRGLVSPEGDCLDLLAPSAVQGSRIGVVTTDPIGTGDDGMLNPAPGGGWFSCPGGADLADGDYTNCFGQNSAAAPIVAGVAGLVLSVNPGLTRVEVEDIIRTTADKIEASVAGYQPSPSSVVGVSRTHGYGRVNAFKAVSQAKDSMGAAKATTTCVIVIVCVILVVLVCCVYKWWRWLPRPWLGPTPTAPT